MIGTQARTLIQPERMAAISPDRTVSTDFDALFLAHYDGVYRLAYRLAGTREEAEDLAQEAFLRLHRTPHLWHTAANPTIEHNVRAWLYRVVTNLAYNALRGERRRQQREDRLAGPLGPVGEADVADAALSAAEQAQAAAQVRRALAALTERQVQLLLLRQSGLSYRELAAELGVAPGSVGTLLARAEAAFVAAYRAANESGEGR
jgi:RNA polymerase sigma-70 factor, ECF subfamily